MCYTYFWHFMMTLSQTNRQIIDKNIIIGNLSIILYEADILSSKNIFGRHGILRDKQIPRIYWKLCPRNMFK